MIVKEEKIRISDEARKSLKKIDFQDTFSTTNHIDSMEEIIRKVFEYSPLWMKNLFSLRRFLTKIVGIKTSSIDNNNQTPAFNVGSRIGNFRIFSIEKNEIILGRDDPHLNFRAVITNNANLAQYNIKVTTLVSYNNIKGRIYMFFINYFHRIVVKSMVKQAYNE